MTTPGDSIDQRYRAGQTVSAEAVCRALNRLQSAAETSAPAATVYLPADDQSAAITALAKEPEGLAWIQTLENAGSRVLRSETGIAAFRVGNVGLAILPGLPLNANRVANGIDDERHCGRCWPPSTRWAWRCCGWVDMPSQCIAGASC